MGTLVWIVLMVISFNPAYGESWTKATPVRVGSKDYLEFKSYFLKHFNDEVKSYDLAESYKIVGDINVYKLEKSCGGPAYYFVPDDGFRVEWKECIKWRKSDNILIIKKTCDKEVAMKSSAFNEGSAGTRLQIFKSEPSASSEKFKIHKTVYYKGAILKNAANDSLKLVIDEGTERVKHAQREFKCEAGELKVLKE